eukprot:5589536-Amphidinium_carterae.1
MMRSHALQVVSHDVVKTTHAQPPSAPSKLRLIKAWPLSPVHFDANLQGRCSPHCCASLGQRHFVALRRQGAARITTKLPASALSRLSSSKGIIMATQSQDCVDVNMLETKRSHLADVSHTTRSTKVFLTHQAGKYDCGKQAVPSLLPA